MSDQDLIIEFLRKAEKRTRSNRHINEIASILAVAFVIPVVFKLLDLIFLFRGRTVIVFLAVWAAATLVWIILRRGGKTPLPEVAGNIDSEARLNDGLKTAYWFIRNPRKSDWVDVQIHQTAQATGRIPIDSVYPRRFPRASLMAAGLLFLLVALNFVPLSLNYNWVYLQAAPPLRLTDEERASLDNALKLLAQAKAEENAEIAQQLQELISDLEQGKISVDDAVRKLDELQQNLNEGDLDSANMTNGIEEMAAILRQSTALQEAAQPMAGGNLDEAASRMRDVAERLDTLSPANLRDMSQKLQEASERPRGGLEDLARALEDTGTSLQSGDRDAGQAGLERIAGELENLKDRLSDQQLRSEAGDELGDLAEALEQREPQPGEASAGQNGKPGDTQGEAGQEGQDAAGQGEAGGENPEVATDDSGQGAEAGEPGGEARNGEQAADAAGQTSPDSANGKGGNSFGGSTQSAPLEGEATSLEVQLQKAALKIELAGSENPDEDTQAAGERERSKLDYRNAPSDLTPAQKDLLSQEHIPWENRQLIKSYFEAVKPAQTK